MLGLFVLVVEREMALIFVIIGENADVDDAATTTVDVGDSVGVLRSIDTYDSSRREEREALVEVEGYNNE